MKILAAQRMLASSPLKVTFTINNSEDGDVLEGNPRLEMPGLANLHTNREKFDWLKKLADKKLKVVKMKVGNGDQFKDKVELNSILRTNKNPEYSLIRKSGYYLATFNF